MENMGEFAMKIGGNKIDTKPPQTKEVFWMPVANELVSGARLIYF